MHLGRDAFQLFDYEKTRNRYKYENALESVEVQRNNFRLHEKLSYRLLIRRLRSSEYVHRHALCSKKN